MQPIGGRHDRPADRRSGLLPRVRRAASTEGYDGQTSAQAAPCGRLTTTEPAPRVRIAATADRSATFGVDVHAPRVPISGHTPLARPLTPPIPFQDKDFR